VLEHSDSQAQGALHTENVLREVHEKDAPWGRDDEADDSTAESHMWEDRGKHVVYTSPRDRVRLPWSSL
jgi:hypothetical protein